jgi:acetyltransferase-like isoleucine patch superfamily enzyme
MKKIVKILILTPYRGVISLFFFAYNYLMFVINKVEYVNMPKIHGKILIKNNGLFSIGKNVTFNSSIDSNLVGLYKISTVAVLNGAKLSIKENTGFSGVSIFCETSIEIGSFCNFGGNVSIWDTDFHPLDYRLRREGLEGTKSTSIQIGDDVFVGANSIILKGVAIGDRAIIGAGSVVTKNIPANEIWAGNPARFIRKIDYSIHNLQ